MSDEKTRKKILVIKLKEAKDSRGYGTYKQCCNAFNRHYKNDINKGLIRPLNKDFLSRVISEKECGMNFSLSNPRFAKLCEFLKVDMDETHTPFKISKAALMVDELIKQKPELEKQIYSVIKSITNLSKGVIAHEIH